MADTANLAAIIMAVASLFGTIMGFVVLARRDEVATLKAELSKAQEKIEALVKENNDLRGLLYEERNRGNLLAERVKQLERDRDEAIRETIMSCPNPTCPLIQELRRG